MRGLAAFVMRGYSPAVMVVTVFAVLSFVLPPLGIVASAAIGLMTLRRGGMIGFGLIFASTFACGVLIWAAVGHSKAAAGLLLLAWLPVWALAIMLRATRSLNVTVEAGLGFGALIIAAGYLHGGDPVATWKGVLEPVVKSLVDARVMDAGQAQGFVARMAGWMTGILAAAFYLQTILALFLARWWQAGLYNPGGFQKEFHDLRLSPVAAVGGAVFSGWILLQGEAAPLLVRYVALLMLAAFFLQGMAVAHNIVKRSGMHSGWLAGLYVLLVIGLPYAEIVLALIGLVDPWVDFRARRNGGSGPSSGKGA